MLLKIDNNDPNNHKVKDEMKRLESIYGKIKELEKTPLPSSNLNVEASNRLIKNSLGMENISNDSEENKTMRKLKGNVALPELPHLNVNKFK